MKISKFTPANAAALQAARMQEALMLQALANEELSSFDGDDYSYQGLQVVGRPAPRKRALGVIGDVKTFTFRIANSHTSAVSFYLTGGLKPSRTGMVADGAFKSTSNESTAYLNGTGSPSTIQEFLEFLRLNPMRAEFIKLDSNVDTQMSYGIQQYRSDVFKGPEAILRTIVPSDYKTADQYQSRIIEIPNADLALDNQTATLFTVAAESVLTITVGVTQIYNTAAIANGR